MPEPEYNPGDWQCRSCPFLTVCGNVEPEPAGSMQHTVDLLFALDSLVRGFQIAEANGDEKGKKAERQLHGGNTWSNNELPRLDRGAWDGFRSTPSAYAPRPRLT